MGLRRCIGLHELLVADDMVKKLIQEHVRLAAVFVAAVGGGMRSLKMMNGMEKLMAGMTDIKQMRMMCIK
jgi:type II secretory ATPase GspE/PulE/Tfp pilus assembly ATPase PilB-like protein